MQIASEDGAEATTSAGTRLSADLSVDDVREPCDVLVIPGGPEWETLIKNDALLDVVRQLNEKARCTASVCTERFCRSRPDFWMAVASRRTGGSHGNGPCVSRP
ncbi:DJ-1/PfpI family protein [Streptomyces sp. NPDC056352]|uniref:DJ-1/PfpI family protein n=1 Tax=Streptomyces sp. NPDC056352 TaxID=3345791 RepID=UPI0035DC83A3